MNQPSNTFPTLDIHAPDNQNNIFGVMGSIDSIPSDLAQPAIRAIYDTALFFGALDDDNKELNASLEKDNQAVLVKNALIYALYGGENGNDEDANARMWRELDIADLFRMLVEKGINMDKIIHYLTTWLNPPERWDDSEDNRSRNRQAISRVLYHLARTFDGLIASEGQDGFIVFKDTLKQERKRDLTNQLRTKISVKFIEEFDYSQRNHGFADGAEDEVISFGDREIIGEVAYFDPESEQIHIQFGKYKSVRVVSYDDFLERGFFLEDTISFDEIDHSILDNEEHPDHDTYTKALRNSVETVLVPNLISVITDENNSERLDQYVYRTRVVYPTRNKKSTESHTIDTIEYPAFDWLMVGLENRVNGILETLSELQKPEDPIELEKWELHHIILPLNELMMIFNARIAEMLPGKLTKDLLDNPAIAEDWELVKKVLGFGPKQSFTDFIFEKVSSKYLFRMIDLVAMAAEKLGKNEITHAVKLGYQGVGKGTFAKTNKRVLRNLREENLLNLESTNEDVKALVEFLIETFALNIGETGTGTGKIAVPNDGDPQFAYSAAVARGTVGGIVSNGGMVNDSYMNVMVMFEMLKMMLRGFDGADVDTLPRTPGQLSDMNKKIIPRFAEKGIEYKTMYQIYEMADAETAELIASHRKEAAIASGILTKEIQALSSKDGYERVFTASPLVATEVLGKDRSKLDNGDMDQLKVFYSARGSEIREHLLSQGRISTVIPNDTPNRDIVLRIYTAHVKGFTKIIRERVARRLIVEQREDDDIIYSLLNRIRSTEGTYKDFINGVAEEIIPVDGTPEEAWRMFIIARIKAANPNLYANIAANSNTELTKLWERVMQIGITEHELTIHPVEA